MFFDIEGTLKKIFRIGFGPNGVNIFVTDDGKLATSSGVDMTDQELVVGPPTADSHATPKIYVDDEIETLGTATEELVSNTKTELREYTDQRIHDVQPQSGIGTVDVKLNYADLLDELTLELGDVPMTRLVYQVVVELREAFALTDTYYLSIGTDDDPELLIPKFDLNRLSQTYVISTAKSFDDNVKLKVFVTKDPDSPVPEPPEQETGDCRIWAIVF